MLLVMRHPKTTASIFSAPILSVCTAFVLAATAAPSFALPPDPERPFEAKTCAQALARLTEARSGNPLISAPDMEKVVRLAEKQAQDLCGAIPAQKDS